MGKDILIQRLFYIFDFIEYKLQSLADSKGVVKLRRGRIKAAALLQL